MIILHYIFLRILQSTTCSQVCTNSFPSSLYTLYLICNFLSSYQVLPFYLFLPKYIHNAHLLIHYISLPFFFSLFLSLSLHIFLRIWSPLLCTLQSPFSPNVNPRQNTQHLLWHEGQQTTTATTGTILRVAFFHSTKLNMYFFLPLPQKIT